MVDQVSCGLRYPAGASAKIPGLQLKASTLSWRIHASNHLEPALGCRSAGRVSSANARKLPVTSGSSWPGRASETFRLVAANLPFAATLSQELRVRRDGRLLAASSQSASS